MFPNKIIGVTLLLLVLGACSSKKMIVTDTVQHDTIIRHTKTVQRDTVLYAPPAGVRLHIPLPNFSTGFLAQKQRKQAGALVNLRQDTLIIDCLCDTLAISARIYDILNQENQRSSQVITKQIFVSYTPWQLKGLATIGGIALLLVGISISKRLFFPSSLMPKGWL